MQGETLGHIRELIRKEIDAISAIPVDESLANAIEMIWMRVHRENGKLITAGMGKAGQIALNMATTFSSTGTCAVFLHPGEAQHGDLGVIRENDVLMLLSNSGKTREVIELMELSRRFHPEVKIIGLTGNAESPVSKSSDLAILTGGAAEICPLGLTPTTSTTLMTVIGDILVVLMMEKIGFTKEQYALRHHSGYLGRKARGED